MFDNYYNQLPQNPEEEKQNAKPKSEPPEVVARPTDYDVSIGKLRTAGAATGTN